jgi:hypothetical protein
MRPKYHDHIKTDYWKEVAESVKARDGYRCRVCNRDRPLEAHHRTYKNLGCEKEHLDDITTLCHRCHTLFHEIAQRTEEGYELAKPVRKKPKGEPLCDPHAKKVLVTKDMAGRFSMRKPAWDWMKQRGIDPMKKGWRKKVVGLWAPIWAIKNITGEELGRAVWRES